MDNDSRLIGVLCGICAAVIWGGSSVVSRYLITSSFDAYELTLLRYAACFPVALLIYCIWYPRLVNKLNWRAFAVLVLLAGPPFHFLVIAGYAFLPAGLGAVVIAGLLAVFTTLGTPLLWRSRLKIGQVIALALVLLGLACLSFQLGGLAETTPEAITAETAGAGTSPAIFGALIFAAAALLWALLNHLVVAWRIDPSALTINLALTAPAFLPVYFLTPGLALSTANMGDVVLQLIYHGLFVALAATFLFFAAVRRLGTGPAALMLALAPALSVIFGQVFLGEILTGLSGLGVVMVLAGFLATLLAGKSAPGSGRQR